MKFKKKKYCAFLDRDGVINFDRGYLNNFKEIKLRKGVLNGLKKLTQSGFLIFIITNQAGVAKGYIKYKELLKLNKKMISFFKKKKIIINKIKFCPHHPKGNINKFRKKCKCRKPGNLMIKEIFQEWNIDRKKSFMIGDRHKDYLAAKKSKLIFEYAKENFEKQIDKILLKFNEKSI